ncbi:MAG: serine/threonine-protein kinase, partial [Gemmataceae bacterium]
MTIATTAALWKTLDALELLDARKIGSARQQLQQQAISDPRTLARLLVRQGWLTTYQVNQLFQPHSQSLVLGSYVLLEPLGEGGMGQVFKARQRPFERIVALKIVRKDRLVKRDAIKRFLREIQLAAQLAHPNIVTAFDADKVDETYFYVMEYVNGSNLGRRVRQHGPLPVLHACEYMRQAALGLQHAHERHIVHRDIKPANLLVAPRSPERPLGTIKILDMGLARLTDVEENELTREGSVLGTVDFLSPEQALNSHAADIRSDLYSLGCTFYYILCGHVPYQGGQATEKLLRHRLEEARPIETIRPDMPAEVGNVVRKLMAKKPEERFQTPDELAAALAESMRALGGDPPVQRIAASRSQERNSTPDEVKGASAATMKIAVRPHLPRPGGWSLTTLGAIWNKRVPKFTLPRRSPRFWVSSAAGLLLAVVLASVLFSSGSAEKGNDESSATTPGSAREAWKELMARNKELRDRPDQLRRELLALRLRYPGSEEARMAMEYGIRLPVPLDQLALKPEGTELPAYVSAVLGE